MTGKPGRSGRPPKVIGHLDDEDTERIKKFKDFVYMQAMGGRNVAYARLLADMYGLIQQRTEKKEERGISADDISKAIASLAGRGESEENTGVDEVQRGRDVLRDEVRVYQGPGKGTDRLYAISTSDPAAEGVEAAQSGSDSEG